MTWIPEIDGWIVATGVLCAMSCALLGCFLLLRRMSMMGDAISHAVLPGLAVAFLVTGSRASVPMFVGAAITGVLTALFTQWISAFGKVDRNASMGIVFTSLFALGLVLIVQSADRVDLDPGCVLYGAIDLTPLDAVEIGSWWIPRAVLVLVPVLLVNVTIVAIFFKELRISAFDPALATTLGIDARIMHYLLMALVAITTVACFESIGSILVIAMLVVPAAAAHLLSDRLIPMIVIALVFGALSAVLGHLAALALPVVLGSLSFFSRPPEASTAGMMAVVAGVMFTAVLLFAPRHGVLGRALARWSMTSRVLREDGLGLLYRLEEMTEESAAVLPARELAEALSLSRTRAALVGRALRRRGWATRVRDGLRLTDAGRAAAARLVRTHRLWEIYLHRKVAVAADHVHGTAHRMEHVTTGDLLDQLEAEATGDRDPHGRALPEK